MKALTLFLTFIVCYTNISSANTEKIWDIRLCEHKNCHPEFFSEILSLKKTENPQKDSNYLFSTIISTDSKMPVTLSSTGATIFSVSINGERIGKSKEGFYKLPLHLSDAVLSVSLSATSDSAALYLLSTDKSIIKTNSKLTDLPSLDLKANISYFDSLTITIGGKINHNTLLNINGIDYGNIHGDWSFNIPAKSLSGDSLSLIAKSYYGIVKKSFPFQVSKTVVNKSSAEPQTIFISKNKHGSEESSPTKLRKSKSVQKSKNGITNEKISSQSDPQITISSSFFDLEKDSTLQCNIKVNQKATWTVQSANQVLKRGSGNAKVNFAASDFESIRGLTTLTLHSEGLQKSSKLFLQKSASLNVDYSKLYLASDRNDSISIKINQDYDSCSFEVYNQDWYPVYSKKVKNEFNWNGTTNTKKKVIHGTYYCIVTVLGPDKSPLNKLHKVTVAPSAVLSMLSLSKDIKKVYYTKNDTFKLQNSLNQTIIDTVLTEGVHKFVINKSDNEKDTITVVIDKTSPDISVSSSVVTKDTLVSIEYSVDGKSVTKDTVLPEGTHAILIDARDEAGNHSQKIITVNVDLTAPVISVPDTVVNKSEDVIIDLFVDGKPVRLDTTLSEGTHTISLVYSDEAGNESSKKITIVVDTTAPDISITSPANNTISNKDSILIEWVVDSVHFSYDTVLSEGTYTISRSAVDIAGNRAVSSVTITIDKTPPVVVITSPKDNHISNNSTINLSWSVDGVKYQVDTTLPEGTHRIIRSASDPAGNIGSDSVTVTIDKTPPVVKITSPANDTVVITNSITVKYTVDSNVKSKSFNLTPGKNTIIISEKDNAGNEGSDSVVLTYSIPTNLVIVSPSKDTILNSTSLHLVWVIGTTAYSLDTTLSEGTHTITRSAISAGLKIEKSIKVTVDLTPPVFKQLSPTAGATYFSTKGKVQVIYSFDGKEYTIDTLVAAGPISIPVHKTDSAGNKTDTTISFILESPAPIIDIKKPGILISTFTPEFVVYYHGGSSSIDCDLTTFKAYLDGKEVTSRFTVKSDTANWLINGTDTLTNGSHTMIVSITNKILNKSSDTLVFNISRVKAEPSAKPDSGKGPLRVNFTTKAFDPLGTVEWYRWDFEGDGIFDQQVQVARTFTYTYNKPGVYFPVLEVLSTTGQRDTATLRVVVTNTLPNAYASVKPSNGPAPLTTTITGWGNSSIGYVKYHHYDIDGDGTFDTSILVKPDTVMLLAEDFETETSAWTPGGNSGAIDRCTWINNVDSIWVTNNVGTYHSNNMNAWILSPVIDIPSESACTLSFWQYFQTYNNYGDTAYVEIDTGSDKFVILSKYYTSYTSNNSIKLSCTQFSGKQIRIRFRFKADAQNTGYGWRLDNIFLYTSSGGINDTIFSEKTQNSSVVWTNNSKGVTWFKTPKSSTTFQLGFQNSWVEASPDTEYYRNNMDCWYTSPLITLSSKASGKFTFWSYLYTNSNKQGDGGTVEISRNNGPFEVISPIGGYPDSIANRCRGYVGGRGNLRPVFDLSPFSGEKIRLRFRFYSDSTYSNYRGWLIDSVRVFEIFPPHVPDTNFVYYENFESGAAGWTFGDATNISSFSLDSITNAPDSAWTTTNDSAFQFSDQMYLVSDSIILPPLHSCTLSYWYRNTYTTGYIQLDTNLTGTFFSLPNNNTGEGTRKIHIKTTGPNGDTVKIRFYYSSYSAGPNKHGWWLDDILVTADSANKPTDTLLFDNGVDTAKWSFVTTNGHRWNRRDKKIKGDGNYWIELSPDTDTYPNNDSSWVKSPEIYLPGGNLEMAFTSYMSVQSGRDGGWLEISTDGNTFQRINPITPTYSSIYKMGGGYEYGYSLTRSWFMPRFNLSSYSGKKVYFRFKFMSDTSSNSGEWIIDNIRIYDLNPSTSIAHTFSTGTYHVNFSAEDNFGNIGSAPAVMTNIYVLPEGSPSVISNATPQNGTAPLTVSFSASCNDSNGTITRYEWDFDGDGTVDWSSTSRGDTSWTYRKGGTYIATVKAYNSRGLFTTEQLQIKVDVKMVMSFTGTYTSRTFNPYKMENMCITTTQSGDMPVSIYIRDKSNLPVRVLVGKTLRATGTYNDFWDGRNESGEIVPSGPYYAVAKYWVGTNEYTLDLADSTGGGQYNPSRVSNNNYHIDPLNNQFLPLTFTIPQPSEVVLFIGLLYGADVRLRTLLNFEPMCSGTYTVYWDGLTDDGKIPYEHSGDLLPGLWGYYLPNNCIWVKSNPPEITNLTLNPSHFVPFNEACGPNGNTNGVTFNFTLSDSASRVYARIYNVQNGKIIWDNLWNNVSAGTHTYFWNGMLENNKFPDENIYRIGFTAEDRFGNQSRVKYNLMKTIYTFKEPSDEY